VGRNIYGALGEGDLFDTRTTEGGWRGKLKEGGGRSNKGGAGEQEKELHEGIQGEKKKKGCRMWYNGGWQRGYRGGQRVKHRSK